MFLSSMMNKKEVIQYTLEEIANLELLYGLDRLAHDLLTKDSLAKYRRSVEGYKKLQVGSQTQDEVACSLALKKAKRLQSLIQKEEADNGKRRLRTKNPAITK